MNLVWLASNGAACVLLACLHFRKVLPRFRMLLAMMVVQAAALDLVPSPGFVYFALWVGTECLLVLCEAATVLEAIQLLIAGRLNTTLWRLRQFGVALAVASFLAGALPALSQTGGGWQNWVPFITRGRGTMALGMMLFLLFSTLVLSRQPVKVAPGAIWHCRMLTVNFAAVSGAMILGWVLPSRQYAWVSLGLYAATGLLFLVWALLLKNAELTIEAAPATQQAALAEAEYREFRNRVRSIRD